MSEYHAGLSLLVQQINIRAMAHDVSTRRRRSFFVIRMILARNVPDFVRCAAQADKSRMKIMHILLEMFRRIPFRIDGDHDDLHLVSRFLQTV